MTDTNILKPDTILNGEQLYNEALDLVIARATETLVIFDQHLKLGDYHSKQRYDRLNQFLASGPHTTLKMVLHDSEYFYQHCSRLQQLLSVYGHKFTIYMTNDHAKIAKDCFVIADQAHYIKRIHIDQARFKFGWDDAQTVQQLQTRFNELLEETTHTLTTTLMGL
jgi:hypothetical protein